MLFTLLLFITAIRTSNAEANKLPPERKEHRCVAERYYPDENQEREPYRVCYYTTWARYRPDPFKMEPSDFNPRLCSHVIIAFAWIRDGRLDFHSEWDDKGIFTDLIVWRDIFPHLKVLAAVGGWNFGSGPFQEVVRSKEARTQFIRSSIEFLEKWELDGLDLDWEYPDWNERENLTLLLKEFHETFTEYAGDVSKPKLLLTAAVPAAETRMGGYDVARIKDYLDFVNVMAYDLHGPWDKKTGHNAPLDSNDGLSVKRGVLMWAEGGMPRSKIVVGVPTYGHAFQLAKPWTSDLGSVAWSGVAGTYTRTSGFFAYYEVCELLNENGTNLHWDRAAGSVPYAVNAKVWISFDNEISLTKKVEWTLEQGFGGVMIWSLALDDLTGLVCDENVTYPLLRAINLALGCDPSAEEAMDTATGEFISEVRRRKQAHKVTWAPVWTTEKVWESTTTPPEPTAAVVESIPKEVKVVSIWENLDPPAVPTPSEAGCDFNGQFRPGKNCSHFVRCDRGVLHNFKCPEGLAYSPSASICLWPWEVDGCMKELGKYWPQLVPTTSMTPPETTTTTEEEEIPPIPEDESPRIVHLGSLAQRRIHENGQYFDVPVSQDHKGHSSSTSNIDLYRGSLLMS